MKLLYDHEIFARQKYGGISRYFYEIIKGISENYSLLPELYLGYNISGYRFDELKNIKLYDKKLNYPYKLHFIINQFNKRGFNKFTFNKNYDIFHKTYYSDIGLNLRSVKVSTIHDMTHELFPQYFTGNDDTALRKRLTIKGSDAFICVSKTTKKDLIDLYNIDPSKIKVIYHGITLKNNANYKNILNKPYLLYVGQRWGYKNFNRLLSAYSSDKSLNSSFDLVCFGGGDFNLSEKLFIKKNDLMEKVKYFSGGDDVLKNLYKYAELFVYTSFYEGFGFPPLEAMEFECPVVSSPGGSVREILGESAVYFDPADASDLLNKIHLILNDNETRKKTVENGLIRVKNYSWDNSVKLHHDFYSELMN